MTITIKDVAKMASVSISTVSRVINDSKPVSEEIKQRVLDVIAETNYKPNPLARNLVLRKNSFIGVIIPDISDYKMGELLNGIEEVGKIYEFDILLCNSYGEPEEEERYIDLLINKQVAGIIFVSKNIQKEQIDIINTSKIPSIYISKNAKDFDIPSVGVNHYKAGEDAAKYILGKGFKKISLVEAVVEQGTKDSEITAGFEKALADKDVLYNKLDITKKGDKVKEAYDFIEDYLKSKQPLPEIFFATGDDIAAGVINALLDSGIKVPEDISVIGYDNSRIATIVRPNLTTVHQPLYDIGALAIGVLIKRISGAEENIENKILEHKIIERDSVRK